MKKTPASLKYRKHNPKHSSIKSSLKDLGIRPTRARGQNFLKSPEALNSWSSFADLKSSEKVLEIGPGLGALTEVIVAVLSPLKAKQLLLIEKEQALVAHLQIKFPQATVLLQDIRDTILEEPTTVVGNIPYSISTDIIHWLFSQRKFVGRAVLMLQKEFADRLAAKPGTRDYGSLTVFLQRHAQVTLGPKISGDAFHPPTKVTSSLISISFYDSPLVAIDDEAFFEKVVRASFSKKRKKIKNSLLSTGFWSADLIQKAFIESGLSPDARAESYSISDFAKLAKFLS